MVACMSLCSLPLFAQYALLPAGGEGSSSTGSVSFSVGQVVYTTVQNDRVLLGQGVQQPYQISTEILVPDLPLSISVYPNPATEWLILSVENFNNEPLSFQFYDILGKLITRQDITAPQTELQLAFLPSAPYLLVVSQAGQRLQTFKIVKN